MLLPAQNDETIAKVLALANALETTRFGDFWALVSGNSKDVASLGANGFEKAAALPQSKSPALRLRKLFAAFAFVEASRVP